MGQLKRQLVLWSAIAVTATVLPGLALADTVSPSHGGGRHGRGDHHHGDHHHGDHHGEAKLSVAGRAISRGATDSYGLQIRGRSGDKPTDAWGRVRFGHKGESVFEGFEGRVTCLSKDADGTVKLTGTVTRSGKRDRDKKMGLGTADDLAFLDEVLSADQSAEPARHGRGRRGDRRGGGELEGKDFAFSLTLDGKPQKFSQPTLGDKGTLTACSGGGTPTLEVTRGRFRAHEAD